VAGQPVFQGDLDSPRGSLARAKIVALLHELLVGEDLVSIDVLVLSFKSIVFNQVLKLNLEHVDLEGHVAEKLHLLACRPTNHIGEAAAPTARRLVPCTITIATLARIATTAAMTSRHQR